MEKIPTLFELNFAQPAWRITNTVTPDCEWAFMGEGVATRKWDGTCCLVKEGKLYKRYDAKKGKTPPPGFEAADEPDATTGHWPGWLPVTDSPADQWHRAAFLENPFPWSEGTYELCGPKIDANPEELAKHLLIPHGKHLLLDCPRTFYGLRDYLSGMDIEGIVFWRDITNPYCDKAKVKKRDFGLARKPT